jgi:hypothetical protein
MAEFSRFLPWALAGLGTVVFLFISPPLALVCLGLSLLGLYDFRQERHAILRNYPLSGRLRLHTARNSPVFHGERRREAAVLAQPAGHGLLAR